MKKLLLLLLICSNVYALNPGDKAPEFSLINQDGKTVKLTDFKNKIVVLEWFNYGCPFVKKHYSGGNMQAIQKTYKNNENVAWLSIVSSAEGKQGHFSTAKEAKEKMNDLGSAADHMLLDELGKVGRAYGAKTTPHMYVIGFDGLIKYVGAIDSVRSADPADIKDATNYVTSALSKVLLKDKPNPSKTKPYGCSVKY